MFSLSEFPAVVGMFFLPVNEYLVAVGLRGRILRSRSGHGQPLIKIGFQPDELSVDGGDLAVDRARVRNVWTLRRTYADWIVAFAADARPRPRSRP